MSALRHRSARKLANTASSTSYGSKRDLSHASRVLALEIELAETLFEGIGTARALTCHLLLKNGEWDQLINLKVDARHYTSHQAFADDYLVTEVFKKNSRLPLGIDRRSVALGKFYDAERQCAESNSRIRRFRENQHVAGPRVIHLVGKTQGIIQRIIGPSPTHRDLRVCEENMRFGPGATTSLSGIVTQGAKFKSRPLDCTPQLVGFRAFCFPHQWKQSVCELRLVHGSRLTTVPKNAKTDRVICIEPDLNIFVQLGVGATIRSRLKSFGLDLSTQENNQRLASLAVERNLATVDLSSASDTISKEVVNLLVPPSWVELLEFCRCPETDIDGTRTVLEKWSSMGNGYTFELETLIFYAVALACTGIEDWDSVLAYGDDIIVPSYALPDLMDMLEFLGFSMNQEKTFGSGLFFESCGTDWFNGRNVRPFYFRSEHHDYESICYLYANNARRWAHRRNGGGSCDSRCLPLWLRCFRAVAPKNAHHIPEGYGDVGFISDFDRAVPSILRRSSRGWEGFRFFYRRIGTVEKRISEQGSLTAFLSGRRSDFKLAFESLRGRHTRPATRIGLSYDWPNLGPWL